MFAVRRPEQIEYRVLVHDNGLVFVLLMPVPGSRRQATGCCYFIFMLISAAGAECVSAPAEMRSTPVSAIDRTVSRVTFPEASTSADPLMTFTASRMASRDML